MLLIISFDSTLSRVLNVLSHLIAEGWQEPLLEYVDPSKVPVHWGGEAVGPDGNTKCSHKVRS